MKRPRSTDPGRRRSGEDAIRLAEVISARAAEMGGRKQRRQSSERYDPAATLSDMNAIEHFARYYAAAAVVSDRDVLDAGCGVGWGAAILAASGASSVTGLDRSRRALAAARERYGSSLELVEGEVGELPFEEGSFDLVVCFEVIEHLDDRHRALDGFKRVLRAGGALIVSSPNVNVHPPGNPYHVHEYAPEELREELAARFRNVRLWHQHNALASILCDEETTTASQVGIRGGVTKLAPFRADQTEYVIAVASDGEPPRLEGTTVLGDPAFLRDLDALARVAAGNTPAPRRAVRALTRRARILLRRGGAAHTRG